MKKFLSILLITVCFFISGCSQNKQTEKTTILKFSSWGSRSEYSILKEVISEYEQQNPNIKIDFIHVPENYFRKLHLLYAAKTAPDVVFINNTYAPLYIKANLLEDLSGQFDENNFYQSACNCFKYDNKIYAIPRDISNLVLYVNKNIIKNPEKIKTIEDLKYFAKKYTSDKVFGLNYEKNPLFWLYYLEYYNGGILSDNGKKCILNSEKSLQGLKIYTDMINVDKSVPQEWQLSSMTSAQMFINGKTALYLSGRWLVPKFRETIKFDWDIIPFPQTETSKILTDASGWAISKASNNKEEALKFIKYLASKETSEKFTKTGLITPARIDVAESIIFLDKKQKPYHSEVFISSIKNSKPTPVNSNYAKIIDETTKEITPILNGKKSIKNIDETFIEKIQKYCDRSL